MDPIRAVQISRAAPDSVGCSIPGCTNESGANETRWGRVGLWGRVRSESWPDQTIHLHTRREQLKDGRQEIKLEILGHLNRVPFLLLFLRLGGLNRFAEGAGVIAVEGHRNRSRKPRLF